MSFKRFNYVNPQLELQKKGVINSGCSRHITGNKSYLSDYKKIEGRFVAFSGNSKGGKITGKGKIRTGKLDFEDVYFVKELKFNLFSVSQMCDKKNNVLFTDTEFVVLSSNFKLTNENRVLLKVPRKDNMYSVDLRNVVPQEGITCLFAKATLDEAGAYKFKNYEQTCEGKSCNFENDITCFLSENSDDKVAGDVEKKTTEDPAKEDDKDDQDLREFESTNDIYTASPLVNFDGLSYFNANPPDDLKMPNLEDTGIFGGAYDDEDFVVGGDMNNLESSMPFSPIATTRVHKDHPIENIIRDIHSTP
ncbi:hypothetical protein Tco_0493324 [Tanacetum coccineum]